MIDVCKVRYELNYKKTVSVGYREDKLVPLSFQNVPYRTVSFLKGSLNDTKHCEVITY